MDFQGHVCQWTLQGVLRSCVVFPPGDMGHAARRRCFFNFAFLIASGVLQGCVMAATIFVISFEATLRLLISVLADQGEVLACADDVLVILRRLASMSLVAHTFALTQKASGLKVSPSKCVIVPLWRSCCMHTISIARNELVRVAPLFGRCEIAGATTFLGFPHWPRFY